MTRTGTLFRRRWPVLAGAAVVLAIALGAGSMFAANSGEEPVHEAAAAQVQPDLTDPGLYANPAASIAEPEAPKPIVAPEALLPEQPQYGYDLGGNQVVPEGSGSLQRWLSDRPDEMGPFSTQDVLAADSLDVEWILYQAVDKNQMTAAEADEFRAWFGQRPSVDEAPELLDYQPPQIVRPGEDGSSVGRY